jgi:sulfate transporter 4
MDDDKQEVTIQESGTTGTSTSAEHEMSYSSSSSGSHGLNNNVAMTRHRKSILQIHNDLSNGKWRKHEVPDPSISRWNDHADAASDRGKYGDGDVVGGAPERCITSYQQTMKQLCSSDRTCQDWIATVLPMYKWLRTYQYKEYLPTDIMAGLTVGVMVIPQSMSYAKLAGLPVQFGLYSSLVPIYAYAIFGSSRQLAVGPVALVSLMLSSGLTAILEKQGITPDNTEDYETIYATLALQTSVLVGIFNLVMGVLRLGFVTIFLSHAVVSGFTSAAAIIIGLSQIKYIFGYDIPNDKSLHKMLYNIFSNIDQFNWKTFLLGTSCVFVLMGMKKLSQNYRNFKWCRAAGPLLVTVVAIVLQAIFDLETRGVPIVGHIPAGLPKFTGSVVFPMSNIFDFGSLSTVVLSIVIIGFMESIAIAKQLAQKHSYELDSSMELVGLGMANLSSGLFGGYPVTGSFSRSAVNNEAGAQSGISGVVTATMVAFTLLFLTSVFELMVCFTFQCGFSPF